MSAQPFPHSPGSFSDLEADTPGTSWPEPSVSEGSTPRSWWMNMLRLVAVWVVLMLACAHLALVLADDMPHACDAGQTSALRVRGTPVSTAQTAADGMSGLGQKMRDAYSTVLGPCVRRSGRA